jgi:TM2 domain-containing membrane protein YozV
MCGEQVLNVAKKCKHCGETLDVALRAAEEARRTAEQLANRRQDSVVQSTWNPGTAAVLSVFWPGMGQIYKGQVAVGFLWMFAVFFGYLLFILPGLILHIVCIFNANSKTT